MWVAPFHDLALDCVREKADVLAEMAIRDGCILSVLLTVNVT